jgi:hypothetical protein
MLIPSVAGSAGMGLLWGWVTGGLEGRVSNPAWTVSALLTATLAFAVAAILLSGLYGLIAFLVSSACALGVHAGWRRSLRQQLVPGDQ